jgi:glycosyltransferase involved in cell wall biosynthesis
VSFITRDISDKVLMVGPDYVNHKGGVGGVIALQKNGFETFNFIPTYRPYESNVRKSFFFIKQAANISLFLFRNPKVKLVHIHASQDGSFFRKLVVLFISKKIFGKKVLSHWHASHFHFFFEGGNKLVKKAILYYFKNCDATVAVSESWRKYYADTFKLTQAHTIFNLSPKVLLNKRVAKQPAENKSIHFVFLGRIGDRKGTFDLMDVIVKRKKELQGKMTLTIGGDGETDKLTSIIQQHQLQDTVQFVGWISGDKKDALLRDADVFILPSYNEGMPLSIIEAMSYGMPVISTPIAGIPEIVYQDRNGMLVTPGDEEALYQAISYYLLHPAAIITHGNASLEIIKDFYPESVMPKLAGIYSSLLN